MWMVSIDCERFSCRTSKNQAVQEPTSVMFQRAVRADSGEYHRADIFGSDKKGSEGQGGWIQESSIQAERQDSCSTEVQG
jgi:hypothetical protein